MTNISSIASQFSADIDYAHDFASCKALFDACVSAFGGDAYETEFINQYNGLGRGGRELTAPGRIFGLPVACAYSLYEMRQQIRRGPEVFDPKYSFSNVAAVAPRLLALLSAGVSEFVTIRGEHGRSVIVPATDKNVFLSGCFARYNRRLEVVYAAYRAADNS